MSYTDSLIIVYCCLSALLHLLKFGIVKTIILRNVLKQLFQALNLFDKCRVNHNKSTIITLLHIAAQTMLSVHTWLSTGP